MDQLKHAARAGDGELRRDTLESLSTLILEIEASPDVLLDGARPNYKDAVYAHATATMTLARSAPSSLPEGRSPVDQCGRAVVFAERLENPSTLAYLIPLLVDSLDGEGRPKDAARALEDGIDNVPFDHGRHGVLLLKYAKRSLRWDDTRAAASAADRLGEWVDDQEAPLDDVVAGYYGLRSELAVRFGLLDRAHEWSRKEKELASSVGRDTLIANAYLHASAFALAKGGLEDVQEVVEEALAQPWISKYRRQETVLRYQLAIARAVRGGDDASQNPIASAAFKDLAASRYLDVRQRIRCHIWLAELSQRSGNSTAAAANLEDARELVGPATGVDEESFLAALECKLALDGDTDIDTLRALRARTLDDLDRFFGKWQETPIRREGAAFLQFGSRRQLLSELIRVTLLLGADGSPDAGAEEALALLHRAQSYGSRARAARYEPCPLAGWRDRLLGVGDGMLVFLPAPDRTHVFVIDRSRVSHFEILGRGKLRAKFDRFERWLDNFLRRGQEGALIESRPGEHLAGVLFSAPIRRAMSTWTGVTVIGLDMVGPLSIETLPWRQEGSEEAVLFGNHFAVSHLSSIPVGMMIAERATGSVAGGGMWIVGAPDDATAGPLIPLTGEVSSRLTDGFDPASTRVLVGPGANIEALHSADLSRAWVLHLVAHGVLREQERPRGLALAATDDSDGRIWAEDIEGLDLPPVVIVSACRAAGGIAPPGDDALAGLSSAFLDAGARWVILARHDIDFDAAMALAESFGAHLRRGERPASALRRARVELSTDDQADHPSYQLMQVVGLLADR